MTIDVDGIIRRERRLRVTRRAAGLLGGLMALTGVVAGGITLGGAPVPHPTVQSAGPASSVPQGGFRLVADTQEEAAATAKRLSMALDEVLHKTAPDARWIYANSYATEIEPGPDGQPPTIRFSDHPKGKRSGPSIFEGGQGVEWRGRKASLKLSIMIDSGQKTGKFVQERTEDPWICREARGCGYESDPTPIRVRQVSLKVAGGRVLTIQLGNNRHSALDPAPLTSEQLLAIATEISAKILP